MGEEMKIVAVIGKIFRILLYILVGIVVTFVTTVLLLGYKLFCVQTGSMEPEYPVGMMIVVEPVSFEQIREGDVVTFTQGENVVVTHRVVEVKKEEKQLITKGDSNNVADSSPVSSQNIIGRVKFGIPGVGWVILFLNTTFGRWMVLIITVAVVGIMLIKRMYFHDKEKEEAEEPGEPDEAGEIHEAEAGEDESEKRSKES